MRFSSSLLSSLAAALLVGCAGDTFAPADLPGSAGAAGSAGQGAGTGGARPGGSSSGGQGGSVTGGTGGAGGSLAGSGGAAGVAGSAAGAAGEAAGGAAGSSNPGGAGGAVAGAGGTNGGAGGAVAGSGGAAGLAGGAGIAGAAGAAGTAGEAGAAGVAGAAGAAGASGEAGAAGAAGAAGGAGAAGNGGAAGSGGATCAVLYVAADGFDLNNTGCRSDKPLKHLATALEVLQGEPDAKEIHICAGAYVETEALVVNLPVKISGGWDCSNKAAWQEGSNVDQHTPTTTITSKQLTGITFTGNAHTNATSSLQRLALSLSPQLPQQGKTTGILLTGGASPTLQQLNVSFDDFFIAQGDSYGSAALSVDSGSNAFIDANVFRSGRGVASDEASVGTVGVAVVYPGPSFHFSRNEVLGGNGIVGGPPGHGSAGMTLDLLGNVVLDDNVIAGGTASDPPPVPGLRAQGTVGLLIRRTGAVGGAVSVTVRGSTISGGGGGRCGAGCTTRGIYVRRFVGDGAIDVKLDRVRVYGGDHAAPLAGKLEPGYTEAIRSEGANVTATSTLIHGGGTLQNTLYPRGIAMVGGSFTANFVTLFPGALPNPADTTSDASVQNAIGFVLTGASKPSITLNDTLIVASDRQTYGIFGDGADACGATYGLAGAHVRYLHTESFGTPAAETNQVGFFGGSSITCPLGLHFDAAAMTAAPGYTFGISDAGHVHGILNDGISDAFAIVGCATSPTCQKLAFDQLALVNTVKEAVLSRTSAALTPACNVGAGIDTAASIAQNTPDLLGLPRDAAAARILGALTRVKATCSSGPVGKL